MKVTLVIVFSTLWGEPSKFGSCDQVPWTSHIISSRRDQRIASDIANRFVAARTRFAMAWFSSSGGLRRRRGWKVLTIRCSGNISTAKQLWLSEALTRNGNCTETPDDKIFIVWHGCNSVDCDRSSLTCIFTGPATGNHCRRSGKSGPHDVSVIRPFIKERARDDDQTLVGPRGAPPAARRRYSHTCLSAES
jgi:hypothetical protein